MQKRFVIIIIILITLLAVSACAPEIPVEEWTIFSIKEKSAIDIQFRLPPEWQVSYEPNEEVLGQWDVPLTPPLCSKDQETEFADSCINLTIMIKDEAEFDKFELLSIITQSMTLSEIGDMETIFVGQHSIEVDGLTLQRYNHKFSIGKEAVQMSFIFFETENAYYLFVTELPYDERNGGVARDFTRLLESIEVTQ